MESKIKLSTKTIVLSLVILLSVLVNSFTVSAYNPFYEQNDILFYDKDAKQPPECTPGSNFSMTSSTTLPAETISKLESMKVKDKAEQNRSSYQLGEKATGVPWVMLAALHFREGSMDPGRSIADGEKLGTGISVDGVKIGDTLDEDAVLAAQHFIEMAKSVYKIDVTKGSLTTEEIGNAFLAYNRGFLYKRDGLDYTKSGYVMQGIDENHISGDWKYLDPFGGHSKSRQLTNGNPGALSVVSYLGMNTGMSACDSGTPFSGDFASFGQCDRRWGNIGYSSGNFCSSACGVVSTAMIITTLKKEEHTPDKILSNVRSYGGEIVGSGSSGTNLAKMMNKEYGLTIEDLNVNNRSGLKDRIETALSKGGIVLTSGKGGRPYSSGGHFVVIYKKMDNGNWLIGDPAGKGDSTSLQATVKDSSYASDPKNILKEYDPSAIITYSHNYMAAVYAE